MPAAADALDQVRKAQARSAAGVDHRIAGPKLQAIDSLDPQRLDAYAVRVVTGCERLVLLPPPRDIGRRGRRARRARSGVQIR